MFFCKVRTARPVISSVFTLFKTKLYSLSLINHKGIATTGGAKSASAVTLIATGKAAATLTANVNGTSAAEGAPVGGATAEAAAGAGVAAEERAGTGSTEEAEVRKLSPPQLLTTNNNSTRDQTQEVRSSCQHSRAVHLWCRRAAADIQGFCGQETERSSRCSLFFVIFCWIVAQCCWEQSVEQAQCGQLWTRINGDWTTRAGAGLITLKVDWKLCLARWEKQLLVYVTFTYLHSQLTRNHVWLNCFFVFDRLQVKVRAGKEGPRLLQLFHHVWLPAAAPAASSAPAHTSASLFLLFLLIRWSFRSWKCSHSNAGSPARQHYRQLVWLLWRPEARWCQQAVQQQRGFTQTALQGLWW